MTSLTPPLAPVAFAIAVALAPWPLAAQVTHQPGKPASETPEASITAAMGAHPHATESAHLSLTPARPASPGDQARAARVLDELRRGIAQYADHRAALAAGYRPFLPEVPQPVYHFTSYRRSIAEAFDFDPARPSSLLYERTAGGGYRLVGAMYHAPRTASLAELDARVPLSVARWHRHVNLCFPQRGDAERWREARNGTPLFGPKGSIATEADCNAAGGRFVPQLFGWMVHVNTAATDPAAVWGGEHAH